MTLRPALCALAVCSLAAVGFAVSGAASIQKGGDLDPSFGTGGIAITQTASSDLIYDIALQPDGKIVAAGITGAAGDSDFAVARYNANGSLDSTFGSGGVAVLSFGPLDDYAQAVAIQPDGRIVVAGFANLGTPPEPKYDFALLRLLPNGTLDPSFGSGGRVTTDVSGSNSDDARAVVLQPDGKIVLAGESYSATSFDFALARYTPSGALDATFGVGGKVVTASGPGVDLLTSVLVQPNGKLVAAGPMQSGGFYDPAVARYGSDGNLDASFGNAGIATVSSGATVLRYSHVALQGDGKLVLTGAFSNGTDRDFGAARLTSGGVLDTTFGSGGKVLTPIGPGNETAGGVALQSDGKIVLAGSVGLDTTPAPPSVFGLVRYDQNGSLDASLGNGGKVTTQVGASASARAVAIQSDGKIVVAGSAAAAIGGPDDFALARYLGADPPCVVPKVKGKQLTAAKRAITAGHCQTGSVKKIKSRKAKGIVLQQTPAAGKQLKNGGKVNLVVSRGRR